MCTYNYCMKGHYVTETNEKNLPLLYMKVYLSACLSLCLSVSGLSAKRECSPKLLKKCTERPKGKDKLR